MHGRPRRAPSQEEQEASAIKAAKLRSLQTQFIHFHHNKIYDNEALELSAKLLEANPEHYTAWNYRKLAVDRRLNQSETENNAESIKAILDEELRLVENALRSNYKSYGAWYHRKWVLSKGHSSTDQELRLLAKFQKADSRNFHAWNYRRFITALKNIPDEEELQYTTDMIYMIIFSNYSAWHNRSALLIRLLKENVKEYSPKENVLTEEL
nr:geranylgeranyl transferase type-2 subunit alpha 1-like [Ipomoea batatas]